MTLSDVWNALKGWMIWKLEPSLPIQEPCKGCEARIDENARLFRLIQQYVERDTVIPQRFDEVEEDKAETKPIQSKKSWREVRRTLEQNSREAASVIRNKKAELDALKPEVGKIQVMTETDLDKEIAEVRGQAHG